MSEAPKLNSLSVFVLAKAKQLREDAGFGGSYTDGGARALELQVECFKAGLNGEIPASWRAWNKEFLRTQDPEYQTFLKLKEKFGE